jgi:hypothetical protein
MPDRMREMELDMIAFNNDVLNLEKKIHKNTFKYGLLKSSLKEDGNNLIDLRVARDKFKTHFTNERYKFETQKKNETLKRKIKDLENKIEILEG